MSVHTPLEPGSDAWLDQFWRKDPSLWSRDETEQRAILNRLGWLDAPAFTRSQMPDIETFVDEVRADKVRHCVLLGMGGSSLAPEVLAQCFGEQSDHPSLSILDTTHPDAVRAFTAQLSIPETLFIVSSKSGTTSETLALFQHFYNATGNNGNQFVAITDPRSPLQRLGETEQFRRVFLNPADIGGRYAALSLVGMVPAAIAGIDIDALLRSAEQEIQFCTTSANPAYQLGQTMAAHARAGRDKLTLMLSPAFASLGAWIEQLVAESTGKHGVGIIAVADEPLSALTAYANDRLFAHIQLADDALNDAEQSYTLAALQRAGHPMVGRRLNSLSDLGAEFFAWEFATAVAGAALHINPFDEPDVNSAKQRTQDLLAQAPTPPLPVSFTDDALTAYSAAGPTHDLDSCLQQWLSQCRDGDYVAILGYLPATCWPELSELRTSLRQRDSAAVCLALGPRYLHSSGQLHKGGANNGLFLMLTDTAEHDLAIPGQPHSFGQLINAQALGDMNVLLDRGRRVLHIHLHDRSRGLSALQQALDRVSS
jgi:glucose-6-phosphate isomerase